MIWSGKSGENCTRMCVQIFECHCLSNNLFFEVHGDLSPVGLPSNSRVYSKPHIDTKHFGLCFNTSLMCVSKKKKQAPVWGASKTVLHSVAVLCNHTGMMQHIWWSFQVEEAWWPLRQWGLKSEVPFLCFPLCLGSNLCLINTTASVKHFYRTWCWVRTT